MRLSVTMMVTEMGHIAQQQAETELFLKVYMYNINCSFFYNLLIPANDVNNTLAPSPPISHIHEQVLAVLKLLV